MKKAYPPARTKAKTAEETAENLSASKKAYMKVWRAKNAFSIHNAWKAWHAANPGANTATSKRSRLKKLELIAGRAKPDKCEICGSPDHISFDHCHKSSVFRGWLCHGCNVALGYVKDNPKTLRALASYVENFEASLKPTKEESAS